MKTISCLLCLSPIFFTQQLTAMVNQETSNTKDTIRLHYNDTITFESIRLAWKSYVIEDIVESDGSPGSQAISIGIVFKSKEKEETWHITVPVTYKEFIHTKPDKITHSFEGYTVCITQASFNIHPNDFMMLSVAKVATHIGTYFIDNKQVREADFHSFLKKLKQVPGTWSCAETSEGGIVSYDGKDDEGKLYHYQSAIENGSSRNSLRLELPLSF